MKVFIDTNVWIDFILERMPFYPYAASVISCAFDKGFKLCLSSLTIVNGIYICCQRNKMPLSTVKMKINALNDVIEICDITSIDINNSFKENWSDFEDGVQHSAAIRNGAEYIITRNEKDFNLSLLPVMTPKEFIERLN